MNNTFAGADEASIVALARAGDDSAYEELVRRFQTLIRNLMRRLCRDNALADDLSQQVFLQAWRRLAKLREPAAFGGWLRRIAISEWLQYLRHRTIALDPLDEDAVYLDVEQPAVDKNIDLDLALSQLSPAVRLCIVLAYNEGMSHSEIVAATAWPLGTIKSHIARGGARLRELLAIYR
jgi:RNA polymerase sigma-70 factor (ECF subfamily)